MRTTFVLLCLALAAPAAAREIRGKAIFKGTPPPAARLVVNKDQRTCGDAQPDESLLVGKGGALVNVVVSVEGLPAPDGEEPEDVVLDQVGCRYAPHVQAARAGANVVAVNSDPIFHNVRGSLGGHRTAFNFAMPIKDQRRKVKLKQAGLIHARCDAGHRWMSAWIRVFDHPFYAVSGDDGTFAIAGVPPGTYTVTAWHETLGTKTAEITVGEAGGTAEFAFAPR